MPLNPRPFPPQDPHGGFRAWSRRAGDGAPPAGPARPAQPLLPGLDLAHPLAKVAAVAFVGYTLGRLVHRRPPKAPPPPPRPQPRPRPDEPYRVRPDRDRSSIRFR